MQTCGPYWGRHSPVFCFSTTIQRVFSWAIAEACRPALHWARLMELKGWSSPQMLRRYGASARSARARRTYDRIMDDSP